MFDKLDTGAMDSNSTIHRKRRKRGTNFLNINVDDTEIVFICKSLDYHQNHRFHLNNAILCQQ